MEGLKARLLAPDPAAAGEGVEDGVEGSGRWGG